MSRQQEKSEATHRAIKEAAMRLFVERGFDDTAVSDIVSAAGYSVGAFYRHFKSKPDVLFELWREFVERYIDESSRGALEYPSFDAAAEYLIMRSDEYYAHPLFKCYNNAGIVKTADTPKANLPQNTELFTNALLELLKRQYPNADTVRLKTFSSVLHTIINAYSSEAALNNSFLLDEATIKEILLLLSGAV